MITVSLYAVNNNNRVVSAFMLQWSMVTIPAPEILGNRNINTGTTLLLKTIVN